MNEAVEIRNPGKLSISSRMTTILWGLSGIGVISFIVLLKTDSPRAWSVFVMDHFYFLSIALGGVFFSALHWLTGAMWSAPLRRLAESFAAYLPFAFLTMVILFFGIHSIYEWSHLEVVKADPILTAKAGYLNPKFFVIRNVIVFLIWGFFAVKMIRHSITQDGSGDYRVNIKNRIYAPAFIIVFALTYTMASFDLLMSLSPHFFSTIFGLYCFSGLMYTTYPTLALVAVYLRRKGILGDIVRKDHLHDVGKFMFSFTVFWAYIAFSQFLFNWYANLPEETFYYLKRLDNGWFWVSAFLLFGKFAVPFFGLLRREHKRNETRLVAVACFMLIAHWIDLAWIVQPEFFAQGPRIGFFEIGVTLGFIGAFGLLVTRFLSRNNIVAIGDPRLREAVFLHHQ